MVANTAYYFPAVFEGAWTITDFGIDVQTAGTAGGKAIIAIYTTTTGWQPSMLIAQTVEISIDTTGLKTAACSASGTPGRYMFMLNQSVNFTPRVRQGAGPIGPVNYSSNTDGFMAARRVAETYSSTAPGTATAWTTRSTNGVDLTPILVVQTT
jgi:hypothetical protein